MSTPKTLSVSEGAPIARAAGVIGIGTLTSRILGFVRDMVIARFFGFTSEAQAFVVAFRIPNLFRDMLAEGAANAAFVPVFSDYEATRNRAEFWELANIFLNVLVVLLGCVVMAGIGLSGWIVRLTAPGFVADKTQLGLTIELTRLMFPYLFLVSLAAYAMGILNALKHFTVSAFAPCFLNIAVVLSVCLFGSDVRALAYGVLVGGVLQCAVHLPVLYRKGFRLSRFMQRFKHPQVTVIGRLLIPRIASSSLYQLNAFVDTIFGSLSSVVGTGGVAVLFYAYRLILFPLGLFSSSLSQAVLPSFSRYVACRQQDNLRDFLAWSLRLTFFMLVPSAVGIMVLAFPLVETVFGGGQFDSAGAHKTAIALIFYSIGLPMFGAGKILQSCFFSLKDTATPAKAAGIALISNIVLNLVLMHPLKIGGIALATSISSVVSFFVLAFCLQRKIGRGHEKEVVGSLIRITAASLGMAGVCLYFLPVWFAAGDKLHQVIRLATIAISGIAVYAALCRILGVKEFDELAGMFRGRCTRPAPGETV